MDILSSILFIILFIILMVFVFSIGLLRPLMPKKELILVLATAFFIGALGGAFFLSPIYNEFPSVASTFEKLNPNNEEVLYLDVSSATDVNNLKDNLTNTKGVKSFEVTGITFNLWKFNEKEQKYLNDVIGNIDSNYKKWDVNTSGKVFIEIEKGYDSNSALKSFSNWYELVYGSKISYALIHIKMVVQSSELDNVKSILLEKNIVPLKMEGPVQDSMEKTNNTMLSYTEFVLASGLFGVVVSIIGIYFDTIIVGFRKFKKFINTKIFKR